MYIAICYMEYHLNFIVYICTIYLEGETAGRRELGFGAAECSGSWWIHAYTCMEKNGRICMNIRIVIYLRLVVLWQVLVHIIYLKKIFSGPQHMSITIILNDWRIWNMNIVNHFFIVEHFGYIHFYTINLTNGKFFIYPLMIHF